MKALYILLLIGFFGLLTWASSYLPGRGTLDAPLQRETSAVGSPVAGDRYIRDSYKETHTVNMVTVVLADYRAFDTLGETIVVVGAGIGVLLIMSNRKA